MLDLYFLDIYADDKDFSFSVPYDSRPGRGLASVRIQN